MSIYDHLNTFDGSKFVKQFAHLLLGGVGIQAENSNTSASLWMILRQDIVMTALYKTFAVNLALLTRA